MEKTLVEKVECADQAISSVAQENAILTPYDLMGDYKEKDLDSWGDYQDWHNFNNWNNWPNH